MQNITHFIGKFNIFSVDVSDIVSINLVTLILENISQRDVTLQHLGNKDKNNNISFEGLDIHYQQYHYSSYQTLCDTSNNVCLNLEICCYSICIMKMNDNRQLKYFMIQYNMILTFLSIILHIISSKNSNFANIMFWL